MKKFLNRYRIDSIRLPNRDYRSAGFYFVTICIKDRLKHFGRVENNKMILSNVGKIAHQNWLDLPSHFNNVVLDEFIIMPNHLHAIIQLLNWKQNIVYTCRDEACLVSTPPIGIYDRQNRVNNYKIINHHKPKPGISPKPGSLPVIIGSYKSSVTKMVNQMDNNFYFTWQTRYYERVIRNEQELNRIRYYIRQNPSKWCRDRNNMGILM